jgi:hypothetical protein
MELGDRSEVVYKLGNKPLYTMFLEKAADMVYAKDLARSRRLETRRSILTEYLQAPNAYANKSQFLAVEIASMLAALPAKTRHKTPPNPVKTVIADIKARFPNIPHAKICSKLDELHIPILNWWRISDNRTWWFAFKDKRLKSRMKSYFSKIAPVLAVKTVTTITGNSR